MTLDRNRILLVHPLEYDASKARRDISRLANIMPPLGQASLAAWLTKHGLQADILDCVADPAAVETLPDYIRQYRPAWIGATCTTACFTAAMRLFERVKALEPDIVTVAGGPHVSALPERSLNDWPQLDVVVAGEGETPLLALMQRGLDEAEAIAGLVIRRDGTAHYTGRQAMIQNLDELPLPAYAKLTGFPQAYRLPIFNYPKTPNCSCISSRGCPYSCSYCDRSVFGRSFRYNSAEYLYEHLAYLRQRFGIRHVNFYDDQFTFNRERVETLCRRLIDEPLGMTYNCAVRAEHVDADLLGLMKASGCWMASLGVESGDAEVLGRHRHNGDPDMVADTIDAVHAAGIRVKALLMIGLPGETAESFRRTIRYIRSLPIDEVNLAKFTPFPGSPLYETVRNAGQFDEDWEKMDCMNTVFVPDGLDRELYEKLFLEFYREHFTRVRTLWNYTTMLWKSPDSWRRFLADVPSFLKFAFRNKRIDAE